MEKYETDVLSVQHLKKSFGSHPVLVDIDFSVRPGELVGLLGHNGAGKSTLIRCLMGSIVSYTGSIFLFGQAVRRGEHPDYPRCGFLIEPAFYDHLSGEENLTLLSLALGGHLDEEIKKALTIVGLFDSKDRKVGQYSYGMRQRLGLAQAILNKPSLLVLDEPTLGLDPVGVEELKAILCDMARDGTAILFSSHQLEDVQDVCSRVLLLSSGRIRIDERMETIVGEKHFRILLDKPISVTVWNILEDLSSVSVELNREEHSVTAKDHGALNQIIRILVKEGQSIASIDATNTRLKDFFLQEER